MTRDELWKRANALYAAYWPGRVTLTPPTIVAMEGAGLSAHEPDAVLVAVRLAGKRSKHPPAVAELLELLEGEPRRVPVYLKDHWGCTRLGADGAPLVKGWTTERAEPAAYVELRRLKGLPAPAKATLPYRPPANLDRPESDGEPRPMLPQGLAEGIGQ